jgi:hypothetical protein
MSAGGATDILIRTLTPKMMEAWLADRRRQTLGRNGVIGDEMAVKAPADGYTCTPIRSRFPSIPASTS